MKRLLVLGFATSVLTIASSLSVSAMPTPKQIVAADSSARVIRVHAGGHSQRGWHPTHGHANSGSRHHRQGHHEKQ
jgi:hypothetical protein